MSQLSLRMLGAIAILGLLTLTFTIMGRGDSDTPASLTSATAVPPAGLGKLAPTGTAEGFDSNQLRFTEVSAKVGLKGDSTEPTPGNVGAFVGGASVGDFDDDGIADLFITRTGAPNRLYRGTANDAFEDVTTSSGMDGGQVAVSDGSAASVWADIDGDDDLDLFVGGVGEQADRLYVNEGPSGFVEQSTERGIGGTSSAQGDGPTGGYATMGAAFADWDRDGDLDLVTTHWAPPGFSESGGYSSDTRTNLCDVERQRSGAPTGGLTGSATPRSHMFENTGAGRFSDVTDKLGLDLVDISAFTPVFADYDGDGWQDLFVTGDFCTSRLYRNTGVGGFVNVTEQAGVGGDENGMGSVVEDLNGDGTLDWLVTSIASGPDAVGCVQGQATVGCSGNRLYLGRGDGTFADATEPFGVRESAWAWGAAGDDLDNDGFRDLAVVNGYADDASAAVGPGSAAAAAFYAEGQPRLWRGSPGGPWIDGAAAAGLKTTGASKALVPFDHDGDGDLDLLVGNTGAPPQLFHSETNPAQHWLSVRLHDAGSANTRAVGAMVRLPKSEQQSGSDAEGSWMGEVRTGSGYQSSGPGSLHIGLSEQDDVSAIEVRWPDSDEFQRYDVESVDTIMEIERTS